MIKNIVIEINGKDVYLALEEAEKLHRELNTLFGKTSLPFNFYDPVGEPSKWFYSPYNDE